MSQPKTKREDQEQAVATDLAVEAGGASVAASAADDSLSKGGAFLLEPVVGPVFCREQFSVEQREIEVMVREFAGERILDHKDELATLNEELSLQLMREAAELGLAAIDIPEAYGGLELDKTTSALVVEALSAGGSASWAVTFAGHVGIGTLPIVFFGTEEQKAKYLPQLATVERLGAYALTEPGAGSDAANLKTTARPSEDGEAFILNGSKQYITNGSWAGLYIVFANLEGEGVTAFIVERESEGLSIGTEEHKMGIKGSSTVSVNLDDVRVPADNLLGKPGQGLPIALNTLNIGRCKLGAGDLGGCKMILKQATQYALERIQFGQPIAFFDAIRKKFADIVVRTYMLDSVIYRTLGQIDTRISALDTDDPQFGKQVMNALEEYAIESSISKILGSETMFWAADHGVQIYGGYGFSEEYPMAAAFRDCRIDRIFEGTNEINRMIVYGYYLKKALMEDLPLREAARAWQESPEEIDGPLSWEIRTLDVARRLTVKCLFEAISLYGQDLRNEQIVGEDLADLVVGYYGASSAINRLLQLDDQQRDGAVYRALTRLVAATYLEDAWRLFYRLRATLFARPGAAGDAASFDALLAELQLPFDPVPEVRVLTDDLFDRGAYRF